MKIAICDDEASCLEKATTAAEKYDDANPELGLVIEKFKSPFDLLEAAEKCGGYDIYILDIVMPGMNGIELGGHLRKAGYDGKIVYLTSSEEYSLDAFRVKAFDYILKPVDDGVFFRVMDDVIAGIAVKKDKHFILKTRSRSIKLTYDSIMYAALEKRAATYYLVGGKTAESTTLRGTFAEAMAEPLTDPRFTLCGAGTMVNLDKITEIENEYVIFGKTYRLFLGEKLCRKLRGIWSDHIFGQEG